MDENIVRILASYGCKYMADDNKEMIEEIEAYVKKREEQLRIGSVGNRLSSDELMKKAKKDVAYKWLDDKGKVDFESGILTGYGWAFE